jgi:hypothetical protein
MLVLQMTRRELPPPYDAWPVHRQRPGVDAVWFVPPRTFVAYAADEWGVVSNVEYLNDRLDEVLPHLGGQPLLTLFDWRHLRGGDPACFGAWSERATSRPAGYLERAHFIIGDSPLLRMGIRTVSLFYSRSLKSRPFAFYTDPDEAHEVLGLPPGGPSSGWVGG